MEESKAPLLCMCSTGANPTADPTTLGSAAKVGGWGQISTKIGREKNTRFVAPPPQDVIYPGLSGSIGRPVLGSGCFLQDWSGNYQDKPQTDKQYQVPTSRTDKQTGLEKYIVNLYYPTLYYPNFQLSDLQSTLPTPLKPVILCFLLSDLIVTLPRGSDNRRSTVHNQHNQMCSRYC